MLIKKVIFFFTAICLSHFTQANSVTLKLLSFEAISFNTVHYEYEIDWSNSWNESISERNHDAVWLFAKQRIVGKNQWNHIKVESLQSNDFELSTTKDSTGFIVKSNASSLNLQSNGRISFDVVSGVTGYEFFLGAIEMVFVSSSPYFLGDASSNHTFENALHEPIKITSEDALEYGDDISSTTFESVAGSVPSNYPKGFDGFYVMKYEISQNQMADFLSMLTYQEQSLVFDPNANLTVGSNPLVSSTNKYYNGLSISQLGNSASGYGAKVICDLKKNNVPFESTDGDDLACNFISWKQLLYYLDWTALRPMTELEFEKSCRGNSNSISKEYAFGSNLVTDANLTRFDSTSNEMNMSVTVSGSGIASHGYSGRQGPLRVGFAANDTTQRLSSGASYWGVMELSGNLWEQTVGVNKANGLLFTGAHGDGNINALPFNWLDNASIVRGGAWNSGIGPSYRDLAVSDRYYYNLSAETARSTTGGRGVRSLKSFK